MFHLQKVIPPGTINSGDGTKGNSWLFATITQSSLGSADQKNGLVALFSVDLMTWSIYTFIAEQRTVMRSTRGPVTLVVGRRDQGQKSRQSILSIWKTNLWESGETRPLPRIRMSRWRIRGTSERVNERHQQMVARDLLLFESAIHCRQGTQCLVRNKVPLHYFVSV